MTTLLAIPPLASLEDRLILSLRAQFGTRFDAIADRAGAAAVHARENPFWGKAAPMAITVSYGPHITATTYRRPECRFCGGIDCGVHPADIEAGFGERYVEPCAFADVCACCGGDCPIDYTGEHQCRLARFEAS